MASSSAQDLSQPEHMAWEVMQFRSLVLLTAVEAPTFNEQQNLKCRLETKMSTDHACCIYIYIQRDITHLAGHDTNHIGALVVPLGVMPGWEGDSTAKGKGGGWTKAWPGVLFSYACSPTLIQKTRVVQLTAIDQSYCTQ